MLWWNELPRRDCGSLVLDGCEEGFRHHLTEMGVGAQQCMVAAPVPSAPEMLKIEQAVRNLICVN